MYISEYGNWIIEDDEFLMVLNGELEDPRSIYDNCGTTSGVRRHTRNKTEICYPCREEHRLYEKKRNRNRGIPKRNKAKHGTISMYSYYGCRCPKCTEANTVYSKEYKHRTQRSVPLEISLRDRPKRLKDYFEAGFKGEMTDEIKKRFHHWFRVEKRYGHTRNEINEYHSQCLTCYYCKCDLIPKVVHMDHRFPTSRGGSDDIKNLVLTCAECNLTKNDMTEKEFRNLNEM